MFDLGSFLFETLDFLIEIQLGHHDQGMIPVDIGHMFEILRIAQRDVLSGFGRMQGFRKLGNILSSFMNFRSPLHGSADRLPGILDQPAFPVLIDLHDDVVSWLGGFADHRRKAAVFCAIGFEKFNNFGIHRLLRKILVRKRVFFIDDIRIKADIHRMMFLSEFLQRIQHEPHEFLVMPVHDRTAGNINQGLVHDKTANQHQRSGGNLIVLISGTDKGAVPVVLQGCPLMRLIQRVLIAVNDKLIHDCRIRIGMKCVLHHSSVP